MLEIKLRSKMIKRAKAEGFFARNINDRFISAYPDIRLGHRNYQQIDVELKVLRVSDSTLRDGSMVNSGLTRLQAIELRDMNLSGMLAVGLIYVEEWKSFVFCNEQRFSPNDASNFSELSMQNPSFFFDLLGQGKKFLVEKNYYVEN